jgi:hypothetical protein
MPALCRRIKQVKKSLPAYPKKGDGKMKCELQIAGAKAILTL